MGHYFDDIDVHMIAAHDDQRGIGCGGVIPWHIPEDLRRFKQLTLGHPVIVGRTTFDGMPELKGRKVIVVSRQRRSVAWKNNAVGATSFQEAIDTARKLDTGHVWIIGGQQGYQHCLYYTDHLHLTRVAGTFNCDTYFPEVSVAEWESVNEGGLNTWQKSEKSTVANTWYMYTRYHRRPVCAY